MNRRRALAALAGLGLLGGSAWAARYGLPGDDPRELPIRVRTIDARGSTAGQQLVPVPDTATVIDLFATWCAPCTDQLSVLRALKPEYDDRVAFVSVTNERVGETLTREDIREWWRSHGGRWTVGLDPKSDLTSALGATALPYLALADADGTVHWDHRGIADRATLRAQLDRVLETG